MWIRNWTSLLGWGWGHFLSPLGSFLIWSTTSLKIKSMPCLYKIKKKPWNHWFLIYRRIYTYWVPLQCWTSYKTASLRQSVIWSEPVLSLLPRYKDMDVDGWQDVNRLKHRPQLQSNPKHFLSTTIQLQRKRHIIDKFPF